MSGHVKVERFAGVSRLEYDGPITIFVQEGGNAAPGVGLYQSDQRGDVPGFFHQVAIARADTTDTDLATELARLIAPDHHLREFVGARQVHITVEVVDREQCGG